MTKVPTRRIKTKQKSKMMMKREMRKMASRTKMRNKIKNQSSSLPISFRRQQMFHVSPGIKIKDSQGQRSSS